MEKVLSPGQMAASTSESIEMIKKVDLVNSSGGMARFTKDNGRMDFSMVLPLTCPNKVF